MGAEGLQGSPDEVLHLALVPSAGDWHLCLGRRDARPVRGVVPAPLVADVVTRVRALTGGPSPLLLLVPGRDAEITAIEEAVGQQLARLVHAVPAAAAELGRAEGLSAAHGGRLVLALDVAHEPLRDLPWELLARGPQAAPMEACGPALIARLADAPPGDRRPPVRVRVATTVLAEDPADPVVGRLTGFIERLVSRLGLSPLRPETAAFADDELVVLHVVAHGERDAGLLALSTGEGSGTLVRRLLPVLPRADLVVLGICHGGGPDQTTETLPERMVRAGARACVAPAGPVRVEAMEMFLAGLYPELAGHRPLSAAVAEGRRRVAESRWPHPDARWHLLSLTLGSLAWAAEPPVLRDGWRPRGWPRPGPVAARMLSAARRFAERSRTGFVGVEHLLWAMLEVPQELPLWLLHALRPARERIEGFLAGFRPKDAPPDWSGTPRLRGWADALRPGFELAELSDLLQRHAAAALEVLLDAPVERAPPAAHLAITEGDATGRRGPAGAPPAVVLECLCGPEDGRRLRLQPGDVIGRCAPDADGEHALYRDTLLEDRRLSRQHLRWQGPGRATLLASADGGRALELPAGTRLLLGRVTWLLALPPEGGAP